MSDQTTSDEISFEEPKLIMNPPPQPFFSLRRLVIVLLLAGATAFLVFSYHDAPDTGGGTGCSNVAVAAWDPCPGSHILRQSQVGVSLQPGYDGRISINGIAIPEDQMIGAILPGTEAYNQLTPEERQLGPRPNNKALVEFEPGEGKAISKFVGQLDIAIRFWKITDGPETGQTITYTIFVT